jgi:hypothetical protein
MAEQHPDDEFDPSTGDGWFRMAMAPTVDPDRPVITTPDPGTAYPRAAAAAHHLRPGITGLPARKVHPV